MQNGIISKEQLSGPGTGRQYARLFNFEWGMYRYKTKGINLIIDLEYPKVITAVAIQGHSGSYIAGTVETFSLHISSTTKDFLKVGVSLSYRILTYYCYDLYNVLIIFFLLYFYINMFFGSLLRTGFRII